MKQSTKELIKRIEANKDSVDTVITSISPLKISSIETINEMEFTAFVDTGKELSKISMPSELIIAYTLKTKLAKI